MSDFSQETNAFRELEFDCIDLIFPTNFIIKENTFNTFNNLVDPRAGKNYVTSDKYLMIQGIIGTRRYMKRFGLNI